MMKKDQLENMTFYLIFLYQKIVLYVLCLHVLMLYTKYLSIIVIHIYVFVENQMNMRRKRLKQQQLIDELTPEDDSEPTSAATSTTAGTTSSPDSSSNRCCRAAFCRGASGMLPIWVTGQQVEKI